MGWSTSKFNEHFIKNHNEESDKGNFLKIDVQYSKKLHELHNDLLLLPERMKIENVEKLVTNLPYKMEYVINKRDLKQALHHGLTSRKVHRMVE